MTEYHCDKCPALATQIVRDVREITPDDARFRTYEPAGELRRGCTEHPPEPSQIFVKDGTHHRIPPEQLARRLREVGVRTTAEADALECEMTVEQALANCYAIARRRLARDRPGDPVDRSWYHIVRFCEEAGLRPPGPLRASPVPGEKIPAAPKARGRARSAPEPKCPKCDSRPCVCHDEYPGA